MLGSQPNVWKHWGTVAKSLGFQLNGKINSKPVQEKGEISVLYRCIYVGFWEISLYKWNLLPEIAKIGLLSYAVKNASILKKWIIRSP